MRVDVAKWQECLTELKLWYSGKPAPDMLPQKDETPTRDMRQMSVPKIDISNVDSNQQLVQKPVSGSGRSA